MSDETNDVTQDDPQDVICSGCGCTYKVWDDLLKIKGIEGAVCLTCVQNKLEELIEYRENVEELENAPAGAYIHIGLNFATHVEAQPIHDLFNAMLNEAANQRVKWGLAHDMKYTRADWTSLFCKLAADIWAVRKHEEIESRIVKLGATVLSCWLALHHHRNPNPSVPPQAPPPASFEPVQGVSDRSIPRGGDIESAIRQRAAQQVAQVELERFEKAYEVDTAGMTPVGDSSTT
jgi:hypothetical protein